MSINLSLDSLRRVGASIQTFSQSLQNTWSIYMCNKAIEDAVNSWNELPATPANSQEWYAVDSIFNANVMLQRYAPSAGWTNAIQTMHYHDALVAASRPPPTDVLTAVRRTLGHVLEAAHSNLLNEASAVRPDSVHTIQRGLNLAYQLATLQTWAHTSEACMSETWMATMENASGWYSRWLREAEEAPMLSEEQTGWNHAVSTMEKSYPSFCSPRMAAPTSRHDMLIV